MTDGHVSEQGVKNKEQRLKRKNITVAPNNEQTRKPSTQKLNN